MSRQAIVIGVGASTAALDLDAGTRPAPICGKLVDASFLR